MRVQKRVWMAGALALLGAACSLSAQSMQAEETADQIKIQFGERPVLVYHKAVVEAPEGVDAVYDRSGFIHPLFTPSGGVVTSIHAPDHVHHMGLWHAWVETEHAGRSLDFWNVGKGGASIRFVETKDLLEEDGAAGFEVVQEHFARGSEDSAGEEVILRETFKVKARAEADAYLIDYDTEQRNVTSEALELKAYRYGGPIAYRGPLHWNKENSRYLTSQGLGREDGHATRARWVAMSGPTEQGTGTVAILCHPENRDAPQRVRIWPEGKIFFNYVPAQEHGFAIAPGEESLMRYRVLVFDGPIDAGRIDRFWQAYAEE